MRLALIQLNVHWHDMPGNLEKIEAFIQRAAEQKADVCVLPEMCLTGFTMDMNAIDSDEGGQAHQEFTRMARTYSMNIIAGHAIKKQGDEMGLNVALAYDREGVQSASYQKIHPFTLLKEDKFYRAGARPSVFGIDGVPSTVFICYDLRFPESMRAVARDVTVMYFIANWPASRAEHWIALLRARAVENQCFAVGVNRVGTDGNGFLYKGDSVVFSPSGEVITQGNDKEEMFIADIEIADVPRIRAEYPFLRDMK